LLNSSDRQLFRIGAIAAMLGPLVLSVSTLMHPLEADPNDAVAAFTEYAADGLWVGTHLGQFLGVVMIVAALVMPSRSLDEGKAAAWSRIGLAGAIATLACTAVLQAVDGVALKFMVDRWAAAPPEQQPAIFEAAFGVRQVEIGLASLTSLLFGITVTAYGIGMTLSPIYPIWVGFLAILDGLGTAVGAIVLAYTGFSESMMMISMPANLLLLVWMIVVGVLMWRRIDKEHTGSSGA